MAAKAPEGFEVRKYPDVSGDEPRDVDQYVCTICEPDWDTFDLELAQAHADAGLHNQLGQPYQTVVPGQEKAT